MTITTKRQPSSGRVAHRQACRATPPPVNRARPAATPHPDEWHATGPGRSWSPHSGTGWWTCWSAAPTRWPTLRPACWRKGRRTAGGAARSLAGFALLSALASCERHVLKGHSPHSVPCPCHAACPAAPRPCCSTRTGSRCWPGSCTRRRCWLPPRRQRPRRRAALLRPDPRRQVGGCTPCLLQGLAAPTQGSALPTPPFSAHKHRHPAATAAAGRGKGKKRGADEDDLSEWAWEPRRKAVLGAVAAIMQVWPPRAPAVPGLLLEPAGAVAPTGLPAPAPNRLSSPPPAPRVPSWTRSWTCGP